MRRELLKLGALSLVAGAVSALGAFGASAQESAKEFYDGNVIRWIVPYDPGGGYDEYSRMLAPFMEKYTGARIDIVNLPGSGGLRGANEIFNSPGDGLTVGIINGSAMVTNQLAEIKGADYRVGDYNFLGRLVADLRVLTVLANGNIQSFQDMLDAEQPVIMGATGLGGSTYVDAVITAEAFNLNQRVVHGFNSSNDVRQALLRGDIQGMWGSLGSALQGVADGDFRIILQNERDRSELLPDVPSVFEFVDTEGTAENSDQILRAWDALNAVGRPVAAPPGVPEDRLTFLREAFDQSVNDPEMREMAAERERELTYLSGADMALIARESTELTPQIQKLFVAAIRGEL